MVVTGLEPHIPQVRARLELLDHLLQAAPGLALPLGPARRLWDALFAPDGATAHQRREIMGWFRRAAEGQANGRVCFEAGVAEALLTDVVVPAALPPPTAAAAAPAAAAAGAAPPGGAVGGEEAKEEGEAAAAAAPGAAQLDAPQPGADPEHKIPKELESEAFELFKSFFLLVNLQAGKLVPAAAGAAGAAGSGAGSALGGLACAVGPAGLAGHADLWRAALGARSAGAARAAVGLLDRLHRALAPGLDAPEIARAYLAECMGRLGAAVAAGAAAGAGPAGAAAAARALEALELLVDEGGGGGGRAARAHAARARGKKARLSVANDLGEDSVAQIGEAIELEVYTSLTVWELRRRLGRAASLAPDKVKLTQGGRVLDDKANGRTLGELGVRSGGGGGGGGGWKLGRRQAPEPAKVDLIGKDNRLVPACIAIFTEWFYLWAPDGLMNREGAAAFIKACTGQIVQPYDPQISHFMATYDEDNDDKLTLKEFLLLYQDTAKIMPHVVWNNLKAMGYRNDLRKEDDDLGGGDHGPAGEGGGGAHAAEADGQPRALLSRSEAYFAQLLGVCARLPGTEAAARAWALLMRLPTHPEALRGLRSLDKVKNPEPDWNLLLDSNSVYRLLYSLQIIESFVEPPVDEGGVELLVSAPSSRTTSAVAAEAPAADGKRREEEAQAKREERLAWRRRFLLYGGFQHLYGVLMAGVGGEEGDAAAAGAGGGRGAAAGAGVRRKCLALTLKVVGTFLLEALAVDNPEALNAAKLVRAQSRSSRPMVPSSSSSEPLPLPPPPPPPAHNLDALPPLPGQGGFLDLDRKLSSKLQARLTDAVDFPALQARVVSLAREAAAAANEAADSGAEDEGSADELAEAALGLWVGTVLAQPHLLQTFFHVMTDDVEGFTFDTLFCKSKMIRREAAHSLRGATGAVGGGGGGGGAARELGRGWYGAAQGPGGLTVPRARFLALLLAELPRVGGGGGGRAECDQYFDLLTALVSDTIEATENAGDDSENNWGVRLVDGTFVNELVQRLLDHPTTEKRGSNKEDKLLVGLMKLIVVIISKVGALRGPVGARLVGPLFAEFLFAPPAPRGGGGGGGNGGGRRAGGEGGEGGAAAEAPPKCKTQASRAAAYELLAAVCRGSRANLERVLADGLAPLLARVDRLARWDYRPSGQERASSGFVGMRNLGNVCYLNSTMQQLFLNEKFRNAIFSCEDPADAKEESVLTQLQLLFGHLQLSERQAANPRGLCNSIKDWDGMPIDVSIQQDAQSFLLQFRDKLEEAMKGTPQEDAFKRAYCGQLVNQLIYKGEVRERLEEFTCISLEVKNMKGVADAFDKFISKDTIEGFSWEEKGPGVDVQKRAVLGTLPPSVILHLNRFTMNMDTFMTEKLNTRFEFPMRLNLEPYTKEGVERREAAQAAVEGGSGGGAAAIEGGEEGAAPPAPGDNGNVAYSLHPREYYEYELVGVQVHYGTANQGHYYSFARDRKGGGGGGDGDGQGKPKWYEFNDSLVRSWNISNLELDCFGGSSASQWTTKDRISNAYLLFYDRVKPKLALPATPALPAAGAGEGAGEEGAGGAPPAAAAGTPPAPSTAVQASVGAVRAAAKFKGNLKKAVSKRGQSDGTVPENVFQEVWHDNDKFSFDRQVYHHDFFKFVSSFLDSTKTSLEGDGKELTEFGKSCVKFGTSFLFDVVAHAYDNDSLKDSVETLTTFFKWAPEEAAKYLDNVAIKGDMEEARELLLECKDKHVRAQYRGFLAALLAALGPAEAPRYLDAEDAPPPPSEGGGGAAAGGEEAAPRRRPATATARFLDGLLALLPGAAKEWARIEQFAQVFEVMANLGPEAREMMLARRVLAHLLDFFLRDKSPFVREGEKRTAMGNKMYSPRLGPLVRAAAALVQHALAAPAAAPGGGATTGRPAAEALGEAERLCLESEAFYELALEEDQDPRAVGRVLCAVFRGDELAAARFSRFILKGLDDATYEGVRPYMALMREWLALDDGLQPLRIELVMGRPLEKDDGGLLKSMWDNRLRYERWLYKILFSLADMLLEIEPLGAYVAAIGEQDAAGPQAGGGGAAAGSAPAQDRYCEWLLKFAARTFMGLNRPGWVDTQECAAVGDKLARWERRHHGASGLERQRLAAARQGGAAELDCNASSGVVVSVVEHYPPKEEGQDERKGEEEANALVWKVKNNRLEKIRFTLTMEVAEGDDPNYVLPNGPVVLEVEAQSSAEVYRARRAAPGGGGWRLARYRWAFELAEGVAAPDIGEADPVAAMQRRQRQAQRAAAGGGGGAAATGGVASYAVAVGTGGDDMMMYDSLMDDGYAADVVWDDMD